MELNLTLEVAGCPTACMHCHSNGMSYRAMPLEDAEWVLEQARGFCESRGLGLRSYPMHEVLAHPQAAQVLWLFADEHFRRYGREAHPPFQPLPTVGTPLAAREDWEEVLESLRPLGTTCLWIHLHGVGEVHDRRVNRPGAFEETCRAVGRIRSAGLRCGCNLFITKESLCQFEAMVETLRRLNLDEVSCEVAQYRPTARWRRHEELRPELEDLLPHAERIWDLTGFHKEVWEDLESHTEAAYVRKALAGDGAVEWRMPSRADEAHLVCRPNLDVYTGHAGQYGERLGSLRREGTEAVLGRGLTEGVISDDAIYFGTDAVPEVAALAREQGDAEGTKIHFTGWSLRNRWLDLALPHRRRY